MVSIIVTGPRGDKSRYRNNLKFIGGVPWILKF